MASRPPDDALARLARWDELRRRANGGRAAAPAPAAEPLPAIDDLLQTLRELAQRHPSLALAVVAEDAGAVWHLRTTNTAAGVEIRAATDDPPPTSTAERLADLLRERPRLLDDPGH